MKIVFKKLEINNFMSFKSAIIDFDDSGYILINGRNKNPSDSAISNGSGKSTIWEALSWILTGSTIRGSKNIVNNHINDTASCTLYMSVDKYDYKIIRTKDPSSLKLEINGEDKSGKGIRDTEKILSEYLPDVTNELIGSVIILGQGLPQRFTNNTPSGRKDILEKLSKSDYMIDDLKRKITYRKSELEKLKRAAEDELLRKTTEQSGIENILTDKITELQNLLQNNIDDTEIAFYLDEYLKNDNISKEYESKINNLLSDYNVIHDYLSTLRDERAKKIEINETQRDEEIIPLNNEKQKLMDKLNILNYQIKNIESIKEFCPTCGQKLERVEKPDVEPLIKEREELNNTKNSIQYNIDILNDKFEKLQDDIVNEYASKISSENSKLNNLQIDIDATKKSKYDYSEKSNEARIKYEKLKLLKDTRESSIHKLKSDITDLENTLKEIDDKILYYNNERDRYDEHINVISKMNTIITRDFRGYILHNIIDFIDEKVKKYSMEVFNHDKISFELDGNNISIKYLDKEYEDLSGGEKQKIDVIVQLALRDMLCDYLNFSCNIIVFDELFDNLDSLGCQNILTLLANNLSDIDATYIITHHTDISIPYDKLIIVEKGTDGISRII